MAITTQVKTEKRGPAVVVGDLTIVPVVEVSIRGICVAGRTVVTGSKRPVAVILQSPDREWRLELPDPDEPPSREELGTAPVGVGVQSSSRTI